jgi:hypothetical protein
VRTLAAVAAFIAFSFAFWAGWFVLLGPPTGLMGFIALAICLVLLRLGAHAFNKVLPKS